MILEHSLFHNLLQFFQADSLDSARIALEEMFKEESHEKILTKAGVSRYIGTLVAKERMELYMRTHLVRIVNSDTEPFYEQ